LQLSIKQFIFTGLQLVGIDSYESPPDRQAFFVVRNPKTKFRSFSSDRTFSSKSLMATAHYSTFARHTKPRHKANLAKELQLPTHGKQSSVRQITAGF
jgi:hypothetical protein